MYKVLTLNNIAQAGLNALPKHQYEVGGEVMQPDGILLRSYKMHDMDLPASLKAVARAGAGVNNIPVDKMTQQGIPVFNAPGANANAVKELVISGMLLASRNICDAWDYVRQLDGDDEAMHTQVEKGKKQFIGFELTGRTLGVIGLGAIGVKVANAAVALGMNVLGFDPAMSVNRAWELSSDVQQASSIDELIKHADFITVHVPLNEHTKDMLNAARIQMMNQNKILLNFARDGIVDEAAVVRALENKKLGCYVSDFPTPMLKGKQGVIALPHLGASTIEAEENCAVMVAKQLKDYLENGNIRNSVNFPEAVMPRNSDACRIAIANANVPNIVGQVSTILGNQGLNIIDLLNKSRGDIAYTIIDVDETVSKETMSLINAVDGVLVARQI